MCIFGIPKRKERDKEAEKKLKKKINQKFTNFVENINLQIQKGQQISIKIKEIYTQTQRQTAMSKR